MTVTYMVGDTRKRSAEIPDGSVSLVACSPPFMALRSYLPDDHPDKAAEIGAERDPGSFVQALLECTVDWGRLLAPWGSIAIELGDTYAGSGGAGGDYNKGGLREGAPTFEGSAARERDSGRGLGRRLDRKPVSMSKNAGIEAAPPDRLRTRRQLAGWPQAKCLALIPQAYALSLAYGRNVLTGDESPAGQWLVRNEIVWHRPNPAVGALGDKFRPSTSYITVATQSPRRWFDLTAVRTVKPQTKHRDNRGGHQRDAIPGRPNQTMNPVDADGFRIVQNPAGAPPLDYWTDWCDDGEGHDGHVGWTQTTQPSKLAHYAMWPAKLAERLVLSMCPAEVCSVCGEPRRRIEHTTNAVGRAVQRRAHHDSPDGAGDGRVDVADINTAPSASERETLGWSDCGHGAFIPGTVLDPFCGTGTTMAVADVHGRDAIGIDLDARNAALYEQRHAEVVKKLAKAS